MGNLLFADLVRLRRSPGLWAAGLLALVFSLTMLFSWYHTNQVFIDLGDTGRVLHLEGFLFSYANYLSYLIAGFSALHLGTEFSSGGVRNKIAHGIPRTRVYLSQMVAVVLGGIAVCIVTPTVSLIVGLPLYGLPRLGAPVVLLTLMGTMLTSLALSTLFTTVITVMGGGAAAIIPCAALALAGQLAASQIKLYLLRCEQLPGTDTRWFDLCRLLYDFLPAGQLARYAALETTGFLSMAGWALALAVLSTAAGLLLFRRQELR